MSTTDLSYKTVDDLLHLAQRANWDMSNDDVALAPFHELARRLKELQTVAKFLIEEDVVSIMAYRIREAEGEGWEGPRVKRCVEIGALLKNVGPA